MSLKSELKRIRKELGIQNPDPDKVIFFDGNTIYIDSEVSILLSKRNQTLVSKGKTHVVLRSFEYNEAIDDELYEKIEQLIEVG